MSRPHEPEDYTSKLQPAGSGRSASVPRSNIHKAKVAGGLLLLEPGARFSKVPKSDLGLRFS